MLGCGGPQTVVEQPKDLIAQDTMELMMKEFIIASEGFKLTEQDTTAAYRDTLTAMAYHAILQRQQVSPQRFLRSYNYYTAQPIVLDSIYYQVLEALSEDKARLEEPDAAAEQDTLPQKLSKEAVVKLQNQKP